METIMPRGVPNARNKNIKARKKLSELYRKGVEVRFDTDGARVGDIIEGTRDPGESFPEPASDEEVAIWIQPASPIQREMALRNGQAAQARSTLRMKKEENSEEFLTSMAFLAELSLDTLIDYLVTADSEVRRTEAMRDVVGRDEWKDFDALRDAVTQYEEMEDLDDTDPEYVAVMERDTEFGRQIDERESELQDSARASLRLLSRQELERRGMDKRKDLVTSQAFMKEYTDQMCWYSCRCPDARHELFFENITEWREQPDLVKDAIREAMTLFIQEGSEAKNSPGAVSGSPRSVPPSEPETSESSTPEGASE